jgi:hypothetical protein
MAVYTDNGVKTFKVSTAGAVAKARLVMLGATAGTVAYPTALGDKIVGTTLAGGAVGDDIPVKLINAPGTHKVTVNASIAMAAGGVLLYPIVAVVAGKLGADPGGGSLRFLGLEASTGGDGSVIECIPAQ